MNDSQDNVKSPAWDVTQAWEAWQAARAAGDADAELLAMRRWSEAQTNASIGLVGQVVRPLAEQLAKARQADLDWRTEERHTRDVQADRLYKEMDGLHGGQAGITSAIEDVARGLGKLDARVGDVETRQGILTDRVVLVGEEISEVKTDVTDLKADMANVKIEQAAIRSEQRELRTQVNTVLTHLKKDRQLLDQYREQHGDE